MSGLYRHLIMFSSMPSNQASLSVKTMLILCTLLCLMASRSLLAAAATTGRRLPQTNPLTVLLEATDEESAASSQRGASNERVNAGRLPPDEVLTPETGDPYEVTTKEYLKGDWCKTFSLKQKVEAPGCIGRTITNRFCYGQCNSFYIPWSDYDDAFRSCSFCKPFRTTVFTVTLRCPGQTPNIQRKKVEKVKQCRCVAVDVS
ncbi:gremlin-1-like [Asterias rubens]|uniref:gremlin-1-like n=1 Tax=Asterias rubens TaxID=7604 RepID=UPI0014557B33|nr:gremlin-1-like [Asterias rubens]